MLEQVGAAKLRVITGLLPELTQPAPVLVVPPGGVMLATP